MNSVSAAARRVLLGLIGRAVTGAPIEPPERGWVDAELALSGFRKTAKSLLVRRLMRRGLEAGPVTILTPALGGLFTIATPGTDFGVGWEILEHGTYEPHVVEFYRRTLKPGMAVLDVGANIGFHALHAATLVGPAGRVIAVEPDPQSAALLRLSLSLAGGGLPVTVLEAALSDAPGELVQSDLGNAGNSGARFTHKERGRLEALVHGVHPQFRTVRAVVWDDGYPDTRIDFVKIDIEGFEPYALRGMERSLARYRPIVLSEFAPSNLTSIGGTEPSAYLAWFRARGYRVELVEERTARPLAVTDEEALRSVGGGHHVDLAFVPES
ncbi:MAG: FkbM family methyltransferase [Acidobacteriia bacterium]|nr:FkbM family methyltransferase [Terriglobia bacterium]